MTLTNCKNDPHSKIGVIPAGATRAVCDASAIPLTGSATTSTPTFPQR
jgi:hypothetical protein